MKDGLTSCHATVMITTLPTSFLYHYNLDSTISVGRLPNTLCKLKNMLTK